MIALQHYVQCGMNGMAQSRPLSRLLQIVNLMLARNGVSDLHNCLLRSIVSGRNCAIFSNLSQHQQLPYILVNAGAKGAF